MKELSYMRPSANGQIILDLNNIPDKAFLNCSMERNICKAKILTRSEKTSMEPGSPDVMIISASGQKQIITRKEFVKNYLHSSGAKIKIPFLKSGKAYTVVSSCNKDCKVLFIPANCIGICNGQKIPGNTYVVANSNNGTVDRGSINKISKKMFVKMYRIPMQESLKRAMTKPKSRNFTLYDKYKNGSVQTRGNRVSMSTMIKPSNTFSNTQPIIDSAALGMNPKNINVNRPTIKLDKPDINKNNTINNTNNQDSQKSVQYPFKALASLTDMSGNVIGYVIANNKGQRRELLMNQVIPLLEQHKIENLTIVNKEINGTIKKIIRGNGISREALPKVMYSGASRR